MERKKTRPRLGGKGSEAAKEHSERIEARPADGYAWQRWAREQSIPPEVARRHKTDPRTAKLALVLLSTYVGPDGTCWPSQAELRRQMADAGERTLRRAIDAVEGAGIVAVERKRPGLDPHTGKPRTNLYSFNFKGPATAMTGGHSHGRSRTGHDDGRDRPPEGEGPAIDGGGTGHPMADKREKLNDPLERSSPTRSPTGDEGASEGHHRSTAPAVADGQRDHLRASDPEHPSEAPAMATAGASVDKLTAEQRANWVELSPENLLDRFSTVVLAENGFLFDERRMTRWPHWYPGDASSGKVAA